MASKEAHDYVEHGDHSVCDATTFSKIFNVTINTWTIDEAVDSISVENNEKIEQAFDAGAEFERKKHEWHNLEENPTDLPNNDCVEVLVKYRMSTTNPIPDDDCECTVGFYDTNNKWVLKSFSWDRPDDDKDNMYGHEILAWKELE